MSWNNFFWQLLKFQIWSENNTKNVVSLLRKGPNGWVCAGDVDPTWGTRRDSKLEESGPMGISQNRSQVVLGSPMQQRDGERARPTNWENMLKALLNQSRQEEHHQRQTGIKQMGRDSILLSWICMEDGQRESGWSSTPKCVKKEWQPINKLSSSGFCQCFVFVGGRMLWFDYKPTPPLQI